MRAIVGLGRSTSFDRCPRLLGGGLVNGFFSLHYFDLKLNNDIPELRKELLSTLLVHFIASVLIRLVSDRRLFFANQVP